MVKFVFLNLLHLKTLYLLILKYLLDYYTNLYTIFLIKLDPVIFILITKNLKYQ